MWSRFGDGITPPNVLETPKPVSSVMIKRTLGAPLGGTTRGGHQVFDWAAFSWMTPPKRGSGGGSCLPEMVVVALGEPGTPVVWGAAAWARGVGRAASGVRWAAAWNSGRRSRTLAAPCRRVSSRVTSWPRQVALTV